jgi:acetyl esterase/lipase
MASSARQGLAFTRVVTAAAALAAACVLVLPAAAGAQDIVVNPSGPPKATVLVVHGGGWAFGDATGSLPVAWYLASHGYQAVSIGYPLRSVPASYRVARRKARRYGATLAVGESAGGTIVSWLAARHRVRAAVEVSGPENLPLWGQSNLPSWWLPNIGAGGAAGWKWSPLRRYSRASAPLLGIYSRGDTVVSLAQGQAIAARGAQLQVLESAQHVPLSYFPHALRFLDSANRRPG